MALTISEEMLRQKEMQIGPISIQYIILVSVPFIDLSPNSSTSLLLKPKLVS